MPSEGFFHVLIMVGALLIAAGCTHPLDAAVVSANAAAHSLTAAHGAITRASRSAQRDAARRVVGDRDNPSVRAEQIDRATEAGKRFRSAWDAYAAARETWIVTVEGIKAAQAAEEAGAEPDTQLVAALVKALAGALKQLEETRSWLTH